MDVDEIWTVRSPFNRDHVYLGLKRVKPQGSPRGQFAHPSEKHVFLDIGRSKILLSIMAPGCPDFAKYNVYITNICTHKIITIPSVKLSKLTKICELQQK